MEQVRREGCPLSANLAGQTDRQQTRVELGEATEEQFTRTPTRSYLKHPSVDTRTIPVSTHRTSCLNIVSVYFPRLI